MAQGFYELLGVDEDAPIDAIRAAYQRRLAQLVRRLRDARRQGADVSILESQERELRGAMDVLADPVRRRRYDAFRSASLGEMPTDAESLWETARASMIDPSSALALALVRALTALPVGDPLPLPPEHRVQRLPERPAPAPRARPALAATWDAERPSIAEGEVRPTAVPPTDPGIPAVRIPGMGETADDWFSASHSADPFPGRGPAVAGAEDWSAEDFTDDVSVDGPRPPAPTAADFGTDFDEDDDFDHLDDPHPGDGGRAALADDDWGRPSHSGPALQVQIDESDFDDVSLDMPRSGAGPRFEMPAPAMPALPTDPVARLASQHGLTGAFLRAVREHQGMSVDEMSRATRISTRYLAAIEDDAHDRLPSATFVRGYLKQIQRVLELTEHDVVDVFMDAYRAARG